jgi:hypothetical protein
MIQSRCKERLDVIVLFTRQLDWSATTNEQVLKFSHNDSNGNEAIPEATACQAARARDRRGLHRK